MEAVPGRTRGGTVLCWTVLGTKVRLEVFYREIGGANA